MHFADTDRPARGSGDNASLLSDIEKVTKVTHDSLAPTITHDGGAIRRYVLVDPDTEVQYLVNDRGGCCPRLDRYGKGMGCAMSDDGPLGSAMVLALLVGLVTTMALGAKLLVIVLSVVLVFVQS